MGREGISGSPRGHRGGGLKITERDGKWHLRGTVRCGKHAVRVRESTGLAATIGNRERAEARRIRREGEILEQLVQGKPAPQPFATAAAHYLEAMKPGATDLRNVGELLAAFGPEPLAKLDGAKIEAFYARRFPADAQASRRRHEATLAAILRHAATEGLLDRAPAWRRARVPTKRGSAMLKRFQPGEVELLIDLAPIHTRPLFATLYATGARVGAALWLRREHFILTPERGRVFFPETKNGRAYDRWLPDYTVEILTGWLDAREDDHPEMFLTHLGRPYLKRKGHGGQVRDAFKRALERLRFALTDKGYQERARALEGATPHWFRHNLANWLFSEGADLERVRRLGMWESDQVLRQNYLTREQEHVEAVAKALPFGTILTRAGKKAENA